MMMNRLSGKPTWGPDVYNGIINDDDRKLPVIRPIQSHGPSVDSKKSIVELQRVAESNSKSSIVCPLLRNARQRLYDVLKIYLPEINMIWLCAEYHVDPEHDSQIYVLINSSKIEWDYANTLYNLLRNNIIPKEETYALMDACQKTQLITWSIKYEPDQFTFATPEYSICLRGSGPTLSVQQCRFTDTNMQGYVIPGTTWNIPGNRQWLVEDFRRAQSYGTLPLESRVFVSICWKMFGYVTPINHYVFPYHPDNYAFLPFVAKDD